ncbi:GGDEF domain-containing protein [Kineococcus indalonis]|uniref:GGDEF domain-containing protein n=1 Tax=Kineococcus indalonis TaxID=2696566 RepID=UPI001413731D|nr:GGDEF domain-containing protein [Kineococcus indalonis]NAZ84693.1 diguanylate cyclase [Kineococcus indalonis]
MAAPGGLVMLALAPLVQAPLLMAAAGVGALVLALWAHLTPPEAPGWVRSGYSAFAAPVIVAGTGAAEAGSALDIGSIALVSPTLLVSMTRSRREIVAQIAWAELVYGTYLLATTPRSSALVGVVVSASVLSVVAACIGWLRTLLDRMVTDLQDSARQDPLTGLLNRRGLTAAMEQAGQTHCHVLLLDVDHFKRINDELGHGTGDAALLWLARLLRHQACPQEVIARIGGEEFVLRLPAAADPLARAEAVRAAVAAPSVEGPVAMTVSIGIASGSCHELSALLTAADAALHQAKREGRNRVCRQR